MLASYIIQNITFDQSSISLQIDGKEVSVELEKISKKLKAATDFQRSFYKISPFGYGIHWSLIDEDLSVAALLELASKQNQR